MRTTRTAAWLGVLGLIAPLVGASAGDDRAVGVGRELFNREWLPNDDRVKDRGGDGLGPAFNETSCVACHNAGGVGGAGPIGRNIAILHASRAPSGLREELTPLQSAAPPPPAATGPALPPGVVAKHPGFRDGRTVVLHRFNTDPNYDAWRAALLHPEGGGGFESNPGTFFGSPDAMNLEPPAEPPGAVEVPTPTSPPPTGRDDPEAPRAGSDSARSGLRTAAIRRRVAAAATPFERARTLQGTIVVDGTNITRSERNTTALFGLGLIDAIPEGALADEAARQATASPETKGRVARVEGGRAGRLGWKGQMAGVGDFVLNACANELGLEVPGVRQASSPLAPRHRAGGLDLTAGECDALAAYVRAIPRPSERPASGAAEAKAVAAGKAAFRAVGCADCHAPKLGGVDGLYSDLLLHDMGDESAVGGSYGDPSNRDSEDDAAAPGQIALAPGEEPPAPKLPPGATRREWRTPPLWGLRDSAPYLHDGRAETIEGAVARHGGQGEAASIRYFELSPRERLELDTFLKTLVAPDATR